MSNSMKYVQGSGGCAAAPKPVSCALLNLAMGCLAMGCLVLAGSGAPILAADIVPANRTANWAYAGVPGGIPNRTIISATLDSSASAAQIQSAIDNCPSNGVVVLGPGNYSLSSGFRINRDGVTVRGTVDSAGQPTTILNFQSVAGGWGLIDISKTTYPTSPSNIRSIVSGYSRGSSTITLSAAPSGLVIGQLLALDQIADEDLVWDHGTQGGNSWGRNGNRTLTQMVRVTGINGSSVTFEPPIMSSYWNAAWSPEAYWWGTGTSQTTKSSGLQDVKINRANGGSGTHNVAMGPADSCWVKNVWSTQCNAAHVRTGWTLNCEVRDSVFTLHDNIGSATYDVWLTYSTCFRVENNIMFNTPCAVGLMSTVGSAVAYNYTTNFVYTQSNWLPECIMVHGGHCTFNLFEGNYVPSFWADWIHGNSSFNLYVRNRVTGWEPGKIGSTRTINLEQNQDNISAIGNVLGTDGYHTIYSSGSTAILNIDADAAATVMIKGNWNVVDHAVPAVESIGSDTIAPSYLYSSKPAWFGDRPWPPVNTSSPQLAITTNFPAGYRYILQAYPPGSGPGTRPNPPSNLRIVGN